MIVQDLDERKGSRIMTNPQPCFCDWCRNEYASRHFVRPYENKLLTDLAFRGILLVETSNSGKRKYSPV